MFRSVRMTPSLDGVLAHAPRRNPACAPRDPGEGKPCNTVMSSGRHVGHGLVRM